MRKPMILLTLLIVSALPAMAQSSEFGFIVGAAKRMHSNPATEDAAGAFLSDELKLSNNSFELFYGLKIDDATSVKFKVGRLEAPVRVTTGETANSTLAHDVDGEIQHLDAVAEYRFDEAFGSTSLFGGVGLYRQSGGDADSTGWGFQVGANADFPISRRYGVMVEAAYHWTRVDYHPEYLTVGAGLRFSF